MSLPLPQGRTSNRFGDMVETIYDHFEKESANLVQSILNRLIVETPVDTNNLRASWRAGAYTTKNVSIRPTKGSVVPLPKYETVKRYGRKERYYIWNIARIERDGKQIPYLQWVNAGIVKGGGTSAKAAANRGFVQRSIARGIKEAQGIRT